MGVKAKDSDCHIRNYGFGGPGVPGFRRGYGTADGDRNSYACENAVSAEKTCTFRVGKVILQREIPKEQVQKLITDGKTDLLPKFISKKGRPFSAHLKLEKGKVGFEFAERAPRAKKTGSRKTAAKTET